MAEFSCFCQQRVIEAGDWVVRTIKVAASFKRFRHYFAASALAVGALAVAQLAHAQTADIDPSQLRQGDTVSAVRGDFNGDGLSDSARLIVGPNVDADLLIWLAPEREPEIKVESLAWRGAMYGTQPRLEIGPQGSLLVRSQNTAIGRWKWEETLTIAYRDSSFVVAGYTYSGYDGIDLTTLDCDINLLTGNGYHNGEVVILAPSRVRLRDWRTERDAPDICQR